MKTFVDGRTPSHYAGMFNRFDALNLLTEHGASLEEKSFEHFTVYDDIIRMDN